MAANPPSNLRVMVDANVLVAGVGWPRFPYEVLRHAVAGDFQLVLSPYVVDEARRRIARLFPDLSPQFEKVLLESGYEKVTTPSSEELALHPDLVRDKKDIPVALAAINAQVVYLVSSDKDLTDPDAPVHQYLKVLLPAKFLREHMGWSSEKLEQIRNRKWSDLS